MAVAANEGCGFGSDGGDSVGRDIAMPVQSRTPSLTITPAILKGTYLESRHSVNASEVASVPPRYEPYVINGRVVIFERLGVAYGRGDGGGEVCVL